jgi:hypothetical protein
MLVSAKNSRGNGDKEMKKHKEHIKYSFKELIQRDLIRVAMVRPYTYMVLSGRAR